MKPLALGLALTCVAFTVSAHGESSGRQPLLASLAKSDVVGMGRFAGYIYSGHFLAKPCVSNITYWVGDTNAAHVVLTYPTWSDGSMFPQDVKENDIVLFWGTRAAWNPLAEGDTLLWDSSAWDTRQKLLRAGSASVPPPDMVNFIGDCLKVASSESAEVAYVSNVVASLCVTTNLVLYSKALIPVLTVSATDDLFIFKADAFEEILKLQWGESEDFLVGVMNDTDFPMQFRRLALSYLKTRFDWPEESEVPDP